MSSENIEKENIEYDSLLFKPILTVGEYENIMESWEGELPYEHDWWKEYTEFGVYFLGCMLRKKQYITITKENYLDYVPIMRKYFLSDKEYETIVKNVAFMKKDTMQPYKETPLYKIYNMMKFWGIRPSITEFMNMEYKKFMKLYLYTLGERYIIPLKGQKPGEIYQ